MSGFDYAQQERRIASLESNRGASLRFGTVTGVDTATGTARVQLPDGDGMVTMPLRVLGRRTLKDKAQALPDIGEPVACLFSGQGLEQGVILGAHYTAKTPSPNQEAQVDYVRYEDGTELWYDRKGHKLTAKVMGDADIETEGRHHGHGQKSHRHRIQDRHHPARPHIRLEEQPLSQQGLRGQGGLHPVRQPDHLQRLPVRAGRGRERGTFPCAGTSTKAWRAARTAESPRVGEVLAHRR
ncbi:MAG: phage baseplate assembly protein V [Bilophila wadsworthia]